MNRMNSDQGNRDNFEAASRAFMEAIKDPNEDPESWDVRRDFLDPMADWLETWLDRASPTPEDIKHLEWFDNCLSVHDDAHLAWERTQIELGALFPGDFAASLERHIQAVGDGARESLDTLEEMSRQTETGITPDGVLRVFTSRRAKPCLRSLRNVSDVVKRRQGDRQHDDKQLDGRIASGENESRIEQFAFRLRGEYYEVQFGQAKALLAAKGKQSRYLLGPRYIAALLARPGHAYTSFDLMIIGNRTYQMAGNPVSINDILGDEGMDQAGLSPGLPESQQPIEDNIASTFEKYRNAIHILEDDLEKADDDGKKTLRAQIAVLKAELKRLHTPTGRPKLLKDMRRSRITSVRQAILRVYESIDELEQPIPGLKEHLEHNIYVVGDSFRYATSPPIDWLVD